MLVLQYSYSNTPCASLAAEQCTVEQAQAWLVVLHGASIADYCISIELEVQSGSTAVIPSTVCRSLACRHVWIAAQRQGCYSS